MSRDIVQTTGALYDLVEVAPNDRKDLERKMIELASAHGWSLMNLDHAKVLVAPEEAAEVTEEILHAIIDGVRKRLAGLDRCTVETAQTETLRLSPGSM